LDILFFDESFSIQYSSVVLYITSKYIAFILTHPEKHPLFSSITTYPLPGYYLAGCGVRVKYGFVKVYAVGTYLDPLAMSAVKNSTPERIQDALLNPTYPRTIRIVMNRGLSIQKYMDGIVESLEPRMQGMDLEK
jgi:hypothetical protein